MVIKRIDDTTFDVAAPNGNRDTAMVLRVTSIGHELVSHVRRGYIHVSTPLRVKLGPKSYAHVSALAIGESITL